MTSETEFKEKFKGIKTEIREKYYSPAGINMPDALANAIEERIKNGILKPEEKLPTVKELATLAGVGSVTANNAYGILKDRGLVESHKRHGLYISALEQTEPTNISQESIRGEGVEQNNSSYEENQLIEMYNRCAKNPGINLEHFYYIILTDPNFQKMIEQRIKLAFSPTILSEEERYG